MDKQQELQVYRFVYEGSYKAISPQHMWGTRQAIASLHACAILEQTERRVAPDELDPHGFYFEQPVGTTVAVETPTQAS